MSSKNIIYLPPCEVVAAGTDSRSVMQAGMKRESTVVEDIEQMKVMLAFSKGEDYSSPCTTKWNVFQGGVHKNIKQPNVETDDPKTVLNTMLEFSKLI